MPRISDGMARRSHGLGCRRPRQRSRRQSTAPPMQHCARLPETVVWGYFAADITPALRIKSGQTVKIDTVSHGGVNTGVDPVTCFGRAGIPPSRC